MADESGFSCLQIRRACGVMGPEAKEVRHGKGRPDLMTTAGPNPSHIDVTRHGNGQYTFIVSRINPDGRKDERCRFRLLSEAR